MKSFLLLFAITAVASAQTWTWAAAKIYEDSPDCSGPFNYGVYKLEECWYDGDNSSYPYRILHCAGSTFSSELCYDSDCSVCVSDETYTTGECQDQIGQSGTIQAECLTEQPMTGCSDDYDFSDSITGKTILWNNADCSSDPYAIGYFQLTTGCFEGTKVECNEGIIESYECSNSDCSGSCVDLGWFPSVCSVNATVGESEMYSCYGDASQVVATFCLTVAAIFLTWF